MKVTKKLLSIALISAALLVFAMTSSAYELCGARQPSAHFLYRWSSDITPAWKNSFLSGMDEWYNTPTPVTFAYDYYNSINISDIFYYLDKGYYGQCERYWNNSTMIFYWTIPAVNTYACQGHTSYFNHGVIVHELGHAFGLDHTDAILRPYPIMDWYSYAFFDQIFWPQNDDINGINAIY